MRSSSFSPKARPTSCIPIGRPPRVNPAGMDSAGRPSALKPRTRRVEAIRTSSAWPPISTSVWPISGATTGVVGTSRQSTCFRIDR